MAASSVQKGVNFMMQNAVTPRFFSAIVIIFLLPGQCFNAQEKTQAALLENILSQMQKVSETTQDIKAEMRLLIYDAEFDETAERSGSFYLIKKGELLRIIFKKPHPREWYVDEKYLIEYFPDTKLATRWTRKKEEERLQTTKSLSYFGIGTTVEELKKSFEIALLEVQDPSEKTQGKKQFILQLVPKTDEVETPYHEIHISVLEGQWLPVEVKGFKGPGSTETWIFSQIKINSGLKEKEVRFRPPRDVVIEDEG
jgi:outer membrane lipoprotein-sorting protein